MTSPLEGVKEGDTLIVNKRTGHSAELHVVERVTASQAVCKTARFKLDSGLKIGTGNTWHSGYATIATDADIAAVYLDIRARNAQAKIASIRVTDANLEAAEAFIAASQPKAEVKS